MTVDQVAARQRGGHPWFWHRDDRRYAVCWDSEGRPFVQGPNMLFTYSWKPHIDAEERGLLDAANCGAMFCHSDWYRDLIARHCGHKKSESHNPTPFVARRSYHFR